MFQPHTKFEVSTNTCYDGLKGSTKCRNCDGLEKLGVTQGYRQCRVITSYLSKVAILTYSTCIWRLRWGDSVWMLPRFSASEN